MQRRVAGAMHLASLPYYAFLMSLKLLFSYSVTVSPRGMQCPDLENEECKLSEILNISLFAILQLKNARLL